MVLNDIIEQAAGREIVEEHGGKFVITIYQKPHYNFTNKNTPSQFASIHTQLATRAYPVLLLA